MKITIYTKAEKTKNPHGVEAGKIHDTDHVQVVHMLLKPGEQILKHTTAVDVFFYVLEGTGIVEIGDEKQEVVKDMLIDSPKNIPHCLYNKSNDIFRVLVVKTPKPTDQQNRQAVQNMLNNKKP